MIVLGIDTSGYINAVGVIQDGAVLADNRFPARTDTLEQIVDNIDVTLKQAGLTLKDVDGIGVGLGPGSWTGIKVGVTVGKMLAFAAGKPVAGIPTLDALAYGVPDKSLPVYAVISAGVKDMVYAARYTFKENEPVREGEYFAGDVKDLLNDLTKVIHEPVIFTGNNVLNLVGLKNPENEPAGYKAESEKDTPASPDLHNVNTDTKYEPVQGWKRDTGSGSDQLAEKNEPAQSGTGDNLNPHHLKAFENETAGEWVAHLAMLRLRSGMGDNPLVLAPMYLKESTAKVFINRYAKKTDP